MNKTLTLQKDGQAFPNISNQIHLADYKYSAKRMGNAPSITATVNYPEQIDHLWDDNVYTEFRGERYFLKQLPSSSKDNTEITYKYSIELVSERIVLENVYFFDVVKENTEDDRQVSNSSDFSFSGDVTQFAERFNYSAKWSGIDYTVVVDDDVVLEDKFIQFQDQFLYNALQSMYETYKVPFYFVGKVIHIGYAQGLIEDTFKYGVDSALISINRNNSGNAIVNRITGLGSDRNITYYYPNPTPKGHVSIEANTSKAKIVIENQVVFANMVPVGSNVTYVVGKDLTPDKYSVLYNDGKIGEETAYNDAGVYFGPNRYSNRFFIPFIQNESGSVSFTVSYNVTKGSSDSISSGSGVRSAKLISRTESIAYILSITDNWNVTYNAKVPPGEYYLGLDVWLGMNVAGVFVDATITASDNKYSYWKIDGDNREYSLSELGVSISGVPSLGDSFSLKIDKRVNAQNNLMPSIYRDTDGEERFYNAENGKYKDDNGKDIIFANQFSSSHPREYIHKDEEIYPTIEGMVNASGLRIDMFSEFAFDENDNDDVYPVGSEKEGQYVHPYFFGKLRKFDGEHGFNIFDHAIEGQPMTVTMKSGKCSACEFTIGVDEETNSFNPVQVTLYDKTTLNGVIPAGTLIRDDEGNVLCGRWPQEKPQKQERQNDTANFEVWIALKKDTQTFGDIMPSRIKNYIPDAGDKFALLNINLPEAYVLAAEDKLEKAVIEYMAENNSPNFNYSAKLSRIFFKENPVIANTLNENSKVSIEYGSFKEDLYVSSYSYSIKDNDSLPEVSIELDNEIKTNKGAIDRLKVEIDNKYKAPISNLKAVTEKIGDNLLFVRGKTSEITTTAEKASAQSALAIATGEKLTASVGSLQASVLTVEGVANLAKEEAATAKAGVTNISNEIGVINTSIKEVKTNASKALDSIAKTDEELVKVKAQTTDDVNRINNSLTKLTSDVSTLEGLVGDEYNIWFEPEYQKEEIPTLENFPAEWWSDDETRFDHDRDLYYSITLGRAWRFMYNDGESFWEEITDADTIAALTKAQEALNKAEEAAKSVKDLEFLKKVFGESSIMEYAVTLSKLLAVTDDNNNVVAGMYGGGVDGLDASGYIDASHGKLMMFAGATDAQSAKNANFRVYSDGCIFANSGAFGGIMKRTKKIIHNVNIHDYTYQDRNGALVMDLTKTGSFIVFGTLPSDVKVRLPWYCSNESAGSIDDFDDLLSILGSKIIVRFTDVNGLFCFETALFLNGPSVSPLCLAINTSSTYVFECKVAKDSFGDINIGWEMTVL